MRPPRPSTAPAPNTPTVVSITTFKIKVADYLRQIERTGGTIIITNRGRQVATVTSVHRRPGNTFVGAGRGTIRVPSGSAPFTALPSWGATDAATRLPAEPIATLILPESSEPSSPPAPRLLTDGQSNEPAPTSQAPAPDTDDAGH